MTRRFTGWHMLGVMLAMFGVIIAVNLVMATLAVRTFGGTVVDNSYVATTRYNHWLAEARAQDARGWRIETSLGALRRVRLVTTSRAGPIDGQVTAIVRHPLGRAPDFKLKFIRQADGGYLSNRPLPPGRWLLNVIVSSGAEEGRFDTEVAA